MTIQPLLANTISASPRWLAALAAAGLLGACATQGYRDAPDYQPAPPPTQVYFYPAEGQTPEQQDRDRYECYVWAVEQTGFDPSQAQFASNARVDVVAVQPSGQDTLAGALGGAFLGAAVSRRHDTGEGAVIGAILGAMLGAASDTSRQERVQAVQQRYDRRGVQRYSQIERRAGDYRRAMAACLEGRGYTVH